MRAAAKVGLVAAGYVGALVIAYVVVAVYVASTSGPDRQTYAAMYDFGDSLLFLAVFVVAALPATAAVLFFLRPHRSFWLALRGRSRRGHHCAGRPDRIRRGQRRRPQLLVRGGGAQDSCLSFVRGRFLPLGSPGSWTRLPARALRRDLDRDAGVRLDGVDVVPPASGSVRLSPSSSQPSPPRSRRAPQLERRPSPPPGARGSPSGTAL